ncbi:MAG: oxygenase MpaB family protein, partial [Pseudomonadota bacterium]
RFATPLSDAEQDRFFEDASPSARLYGATAAASRHDTARIYEAMRPGLAPSAILDEYFEIVSNAPAIPWPLKGLQAPAIRAAIDIIPTDIRATLGLESQLTEEDTRRLKRAAGIANRIAIPLSPQVQACRRLGLPGDYLHRAANRTAVGDAPA